MKVVHTYDSTYLRPLTITTSPLPPSLSFRIQRPSSFQIPYWIYLTSLIFDRISPKIEYLFVIHTPLFRFVLLFWIQLRYFVALKIFSFITITIDTPHNFRLFSSIYISYLLPPPLQYWQSNSLNQLHSCVLFFPSIYHVSVVYFPPILISFSI